MQQHSGGQHRLKPGPHYHPVTQGNPQAPSFSRPQLAPLQYGEKALCEVRGSSRSLLQPCSTGQEVPSPHSLWVCPCDFR